MGARTGVHTGRFDLVVVLLFAFQFVNQHII